MANTKLSKGTRVELLEIKDEHTTLKPGDKGSVTFVDDLGTVFVKWDSGSNLGLIPGVDRFIEIEE